MPARDDPDLTLFPPSPGGSSDASSNSLPGSLSGSLPGSLSGSLPGSVSGSLSGSMSDGSASAGPFSSRASSADGAAAGSFDEYRLIRRIGRGGMGEVWLADDVWLDRRVAVKFIGWLDAHADVRQQFLQEARLAARLSHPNVVTIYRVGEKSGKPFIVTELLQGKSLKQLDKPVTSAEALRIGIGLARGLAAAHRAGILHCDIKPANAIATDAGEIKLLDFGLARFYEPKRPSVVPTPPPSRRAGELSASPGRSVVFGTPRYMAPEMWSGEGPSPRTDVFSLGAVLFELCTGCAPNDDVGSSPEFRAIVVQRETPRIADVATGIDPRLAQVIDACLSREPGKRFASGEELCVALEEIATGGPRSGLPEGNPYRGLAPFEAEHRGLFFGRARETRAIVDRLRGQSIVLVAADSGLGKSSLCRAGVIPEFLSGNLGDGRSWSSVTLMPMDRPIEMLASSLASALPLELEGEGDRDAMAERIRSERGLFVREVRRALGRERGLLIFVDQMEELATLAEPRDVEPFCEVLAVLARDAPGVRILGAVRGDFVARVASLPGLAEQASRAIYVLGPSSPAQLREAIVGPAEAKGVKFESEALVADLVASSSSGGLPLLQFTLTELWEARDRKANIITKNSLEEIGGVFGALSRHADGVMASMLPERRREAFRILVALVTSHGTRARKRAADLPGEAGTREAALDALVRGRILHARDVDGEAAYELSHEALIRGWRAFAQKLDQAAGARVAHERLSSAALEWERLGRTREATYGARQLEEAVGIDEIGLSGLEKSFVAASVRRVRLERLRRWGLFASVPALLLLSYGALDSYARREVRARADAVLADARLTLAEARRAVRDATEAKEKALAMFDAGESQNAEKQWQKVLSAIAAADVSMARATQELEAAQKVIPGRPEVESSLREVLFERAMFAEQAGEAARAGELIERASVYDPGGELIGRFREKGALTVTSDPPGAQVAYEWYAQTKGFLWPPMRADEVDHTPLTNKDFPQGSFLLIFSAEGRAVVRYPVIVGRGERLTIHVDLPRLEDVPAGFVYVPPGRFLQGAKGEALRATYFEAAPLHQATTDAYLIAKNETTFGEWIEYLRALDPETRASRTPREADAPLAERLLVLGEDGRYTLRIRPSHETYVAREGERLRYLGRTTGAEHDWRLMPVVGVSFADAVAYGKWLAETGKVAGARLCTEWEWERAARGADGRPFPGGDDLPEGSANIDGVQPSEGIGIDEVGQFPASRSPFGIDDMIGNAWEWAMPRTKGTTTLRKGGSYRQPMLLSRAENRALDPLTDVQTGIRMCATPSWPRTRGR